MKNITDFTGLSTLEVSALLKKDGFNELSSQQKKNGLQLLFKVLSEPMLLLLLSAGVVYFFMGEVSDALILLFAVVAVISLTLYQEIKTEKTLEALKDLSSPRALVLRDNTEQMIPGRELVIGDLVFIHEGDRVPADALVLSSENLAADESLLTGESLAVRKIDWDGTLEVQRPGGDDLPFVYASSLVTSGRAIIRITAIGLNTEIGKIGKSLDSIKDEETLLHKETSKIVRQVAQVAVSLCLLVFLFSYLIKQDFIGGILNGLTLAMAILPEEFPVVLTIFLTIGAWRISRKNVLTRRAATIETLGAATVLCSDKTGTLTFNRMELGALATSDKYLELLGSTKNKLDTEFINLLSTSILASQADPFDPIEKELLLKGKLYLPKTSLTKSLELFKEYPLTKDLLAMSQIWRPLDEAKLTVATKGAPETILDLCGVSGSKRQAWEAKIVQMSNNGLRVLAVARGTLDVKKIPESQKDFSLNFVGLLGFIDQIRPSVPGAVLEARAAGIRVIMITGDYPGTAQFIAKKIGLQNPDNYLTGLDLEKMSEQELQEKIKVTNIFARVLPEQKLIIVNALKANQEIVAMTGDGVNDAPALKAAHIGVAMGQRGTDVAREASSLILLDDDFSSIVLAVRLGRRIYNNLKRSMGYILAVHVPIAGISIIPIFFGLPIILFPAHIAFMELLIDPACSLAFESEKETDDIMKKPPRKISESIFSRKTVLLNLAQGLSLLFGVLILFLLALSAGRSDNEIRSIVFSALIIGNLLLITINLSWELNLFKILQSAHPVVFFIIFGALSCLLLTIYVPFLANIFNLSPITWSDLALVLVVSLFSLLWFELFKWSNYRKKA